MTDAAQNSKQVLAQKGTAATPSFSFLGGNVTGMYLAGANQLGFSTAGVNAVTIDASQNVTVTGSFITPTIAGGTTASSTLTLESTTGAGTTDSILFKTGSQSTRMTIDTSGNVGIASGNLTFSGTSQRITGDMSNATIANRVLFQTSTTNGSSYISVIPNGTASAAGFMAFASSSDPSNTSTLQTRVALDNNECALYSSRTGTGTYLPMTFYTNGSEQMRIDSSGNVGIGTSSPGTKLTIAASVEAGARFLGNGLTSLGLFVGYNSAAYVYNDSNTPMIFGTNATERMRIDASGNVGIGTSSPSALGKFAVVSGSSYAGVNSGTYNTAFFGPRPANDGYCTLTYSWSTSGSGNFWVNDYQSTSINWGYFSGGSNLGTYMSLTSSGNLGIGTSSPSYPLDIQANSSAFGANIRGRAADGIAVLRFADNSNTEIARIDCRPTGIIRIANTSSNTEVMRIDASGNVIAGGSVALATTATNGFLYVPTCAGTPTGTPTAVTGMAPIVVNTTNNKLYFYSGGAWRDAGP
jgi:hypothetical protein